MREARVAVVIHAGLGNHKTTRTLSDLPILDAYWWHLASRMPPPSPPPRGEQEVVGSKVRHYGGAPVLGGTEPESPPTPCK